MGADGEREREQKRILKKYFQYHIPFLVLAIIFFVLSAAVGAHSSEGKILLSLGILFLLAMPPASLYLVKKHYLSKKAYK